MFERLPLRRVDRIIFDEVPQDRTIVVVPNRRIERGHALRGLLRLDNVLQRGFEFDGELLRGRHLPVLLDIVPFYLVDLADKLVDMGRDPDGARSVGNRSQDCLTNPPCGVGGKLKSSCIVELLDRLHQSQIPLLDQVEKRESATAILLGDRYDETQVCLGEFFLSPFVPDLDLLG